MKKIIAIDPDLHKSGFSQYDVDTCKVEEISSFDMFEIMSRIASLVFEGKLEKVIIEDANLIKGSWHGKTARENVGKNKAVATIFINFCQTRKIPFGVLRPDGYSKTFDDIKIFKETSKWTKVTNKDARASFAMIYRNYKVIAP